jgi:DNA gyrase subunit A
VRAVAATSDGYAAALQPGAVRRAQHARRPPLRPDGRRKLPWCASSATPDEILIAATRQARAILTGAEEINFLSCPGRGVILIKLTSPSSASWRPPATAIC